MIEAIRDLFLPPAKSTVAPAVDSVFWFVHISSLVITVGILIALIYFVFKYRRKSENEVTPVITHNNKLEVTWSVIPLIMVLIVFAWGYQGFMELRNIPDDAYEINVTAQKWIWRFQYPNGAQTTGELHVPAGRPVRLVMSSQDVIHSFFVPDYRVKQDVVPGRYTDLWFEVKEPGESIIFCTEYCGTDHSNMTGTVIAHAQGDFEDWLAANAGGGAAGPPNGLSMAEWGEQLVQQQGCMACHSTDGTQMVGPSWQGKYGSQEPLQGGESIEVDENYLRESILDPNAKLVEGYQPVMPSYQGALNDQQIDAIIEYIKTLK
ncbi:MAG: cytochrome c oxidase subunit II [Balneolaceae bacterium]|nr:cytochrome c oxidase subunit II [Balneolaceae bacterium]